MKMKRSVFVFSLFAALLMLPMAAMADSITPADYSATLAVGESVTITKTVTITPEVTSALVDVFFLTDSTGSMGGLINSVKTSASAILAATSGLGDVAYGVGEYRDVGDAFVYRTNTAITDNTVAVQTGINAWFASGGGDLPEANLYALEQVAKTASWRTGSTRILVWFGDAPGHDPRLGSTEASATAALIANSVVVEALNVGSLNSTGQASRIADATGGDYYASINTSAIVDEISNAIKSVFEEYSAVSLDLSEVPTGVTVSVAPGTYTGDYDRSVERTFDFDVTFTGDSPGAYDFNIYALVDGGRVATERDRITVGTPEPASILLLGASLLGLFGLRRKFN